MLIKGKNNMDSILAEDKPSLNLVRKIIRNNSVFYEFECNGEKRQYNTEQSIAMIKRFPPENRNCQTDNVHISRKAGQGDTPVCYEGNNTGGTGKRYQKLLYHGNQSIPSGINIFMGKKYLDICTVYSNDLYFYNVINDSAFLKKYAHYIQEIDKAEIINYTAYKIETPFGAAGIHDLSTGLKTLLNILYLKEQKAVFALVNIDECGENILPYIFKEVNNTNIALYLDHYIMRLPEESRIYFNGKRVADNFELTQMIHRMGESV